MTVLFDLEEDTSDTYVFFQFVATYVTRDASDRAGRKKVHSRVITKQLRTSGSLATVCSSVDVNLVGTLIAKRSVLLATKAGGASPMTEIYKDLDEQVVDIVSFINKERKYRNRSQQVYRDLLQSSQGGASNGVMVSNGRVGQSGGEDEGEGEDGSTYTMFSAAPHLVELPKMLFHLRRGTLLGPLLQHPDDMDFVRMLFLRANRMDAQRLLLPSLLSFNSTGRFEELPLETLGLQSNRILFLDHHTQVLVWSGAHVAGPAFDVFRSACQQRAAANSANRLPCPRVLVFKERSSAARWMQCRLIPSHKDPIEQQRLSFPQVAALSAEDMRELVSKFTPSHEMSFHQYYKMLFP